MGCSVSITAAVVARARPACSQRAENPCTKSFSESPASPRSISHSRMDSMSLSCMKQSSHKIQKTRLLGRAHHRDQHWSKVQLQQDCTTVVPIEVGLNEFSRRSPCRTDRALCTSMGYRMEHSPQSPMRLRSRRPFLPFYDSSPQTRSDSIKWRYCATYWRDSEGATLQIHIVSSTMTTSCYSLRQCAFRRVVFFATTCFLLAGTLSERAHAEPSANFDKGGRIIRPVKVVSTTGNVTNAQALVSGRGGYTTLTMEDGGIAPMVILDYGLDVGGLPVFDVSAVSGTPKLQAIYSEAEQWLLPIGDGSYANGNEMSVSYVGSCGAASLSRVNAYSILRPGRIVNRLIQGGQRFQAITLTTPGTVILGGVGLQPTFIPSHESDLKSTDNLSQRGTNLPRSLDNRGSFRCSDPALGEIWSLGAYTLETNQVPAGSLPPTFTSTREGLDVKGSTFCVYQAGTAWSNYTVTFDVQVVANETGWMVNTDPVFGYRFVLAANNNTAGPPNTLRLTIPFSPGTLVQVPLPSVLILSRASGTLSEPLPPAQRLMFSSKTSWS